MSWHTIGRAAQNGCCCILVLERSLIKFAEWGPPAVGHRKRDVAIFLYWLHGRG